MKKYNESQLWNVSSQEASGWMRKKAIVYCKDDSKIEGTIDCIGRNALPLSSVVPPEDRTFTDLTIDGKFVDLRNITELHVEE